MGDLLHSTDLLGFRAERSPDRQALVEVDRSESWTYAALNVQVDATAAGLLERGVETGDVVATVNDDPAVVGRLCHATFRIGATLAPLNVALGEATLENQVRRLEPSLVVANDAALDGEREREWPLIEPSAVVEFDAESGDETHRSVTDRADGAGPIESDATALVVFTSGTTGRPKGVRLTVQNLVSSAVASACRLGVTPRDRWLVPLAPYHVGGLAPFVRSACYGTATVTTQGFDVSAVAAVLDDRSITAVSLVPTMLERLLDHGWRPAPHLRFLLLGGGPIPESLVERCDRHDVPVCPTYGTTETASQVATATPMEAFANPTTVGQPLHGTAVTVSDGDERAEAGDAGELVVEGPTVSPGYLDDEATDAAFDADGFSTGDVGHLDANGRLYVHGRADDVIVTGGENVQPDRVVAALESHQDVAAAAVVGVSDPTWGERVVALVVPIGEASAVGAPTTKDLQDHCRDRVPDFAVPKDVAFAESLPRTPSGTVDREAVRERFR